MFEFQIRAATPDDAADIARLIDQLADYEGLSGESSPDTDALRQHLDPEAYPRCEALVAVDVTTGKKVGFALYFWNYSTFLTRFGIYLEDLFVKTEFRGRGVGYALFKRLAQIAVDRGCERMDWNVLDWNDLALDFYSRLGARTLDDWKTVRLEGPALRKLGSD